MAATLTFDVAAFRTQFPAFASATTYPTITLQGYWDTATCYISDANTGRLTDDCRQTAINMMTAHLAAIADMIAAGKTVGYAQSATVDKVSVTMTPPPVKNQLQWWLNLTPYGMQLYALLFMRSRGGFTIGGSAEGKAFRKAFGVY
jgi:hypothetical protein